MKTIILKSIMLTNFKGIRSLSINGLSIENFINGANGVGKTTVFDAFTWLLFGKDSADRKDFEVKTLDQNNNIIPKIDHEVEAELLIDGDTVTLKRILREKWVTRRGSIEPEFKGNETVYEWNGVPMNASEYSSKINNIIDEKVFKMITNPAAFNAMKWQDQRDALIDMAGIITDNQIADGNAEFEALLSQLSDKSLDEYKKQIKASVSKSKQELKSIPTRIDEVSRSKPEPLDFDTLNKQLQEKQKAVEAINDQITDELKAQQALIDKKSEIKTKIQTIDHKVSDIKHGIRIKAKEQFRQQNSGKDALQSKYNEKESELQTSANALGTLKSRLETKNSEISRLNARMAELRKDWEELNAEAVVCDIESSCPTCKQELPTENIEAKKAEMQKNAADKKQKELNSINHLGKSLKETLDATTKERDDIQARIDTGLKKVGELTEAVNALEHQLKSGPKETKSLDDIYNQLLKADTELPNLYKASTELSEQYDNIGGVNVEGFKRTKSELQKEVDEIKSQLHLQVQIKSADERIEALSKEETHLGQTVADLERELFTIEAFEKEKSTRIESSVNKRFQLVNFKLFETQINGAEVPTCKALINGVPFSDANTASKINAGLDIINTLCQHYNVSAPVFIDNRESVVELIDTQSQIINLVVSEEDKKLRVVSVGELMEAV